MAGKDYILYGGEKKDVNALWGFQGPIVTDPERGIAIPVAPQKAEQIYSSFEPSVITEAEVIGGDIVAAEMHLAAQTAPKDRQLDSQVHDLLPKEQLNR